MISTGSEQRVADSAITRKGAAVTITWRNADAMASRQLAAAIPAWVRDPELYALVIRFVESKSVIAREPPIVAEATQLAWRIECFSKPTISLLLGDVTAHSLGLALCGTHRVAGETFQLRFTSEDLLVRPNGVFGHFLAQLSDSLGTYVALCNPTLNRADAHFLGLASHSIDVSNFDEIETLIAGADTVDPVLDDRHREPEASTIAPHRSAIARCFSADSVVEIIERLEQETDTQAHWAQQSIDQLRSGRAAEQAAILQHFRMLKPLDRHDALIASYNVILRDAAAEPFHLPTRQEMQSLRSMT